MAIDESLGAWSTRVWDLFRRWPWWAQSLGWLGGWWLLLALLTWRSSRSRVFKVVATTAIGILFTAAVAGASGSKRPSQTSALPPPTPSPSASIVLGSPPAPTIASAAPLLASPSSKASPKPAPSKQPPAHPLLSCPGPPLRGVYHSYRLHVLGACRWYSGTVIAVIHEADGDYHLRVTPAAGYKGFLDAGNYSQQYGALVGEIMPGQKLPLPSVDEHVALFGTWVYDADHGWNEIHPIWAIRYLDTGTTVYSLPPATPQHEPGSSGGGSGGGTGGGSSNCDPNYVVTGGPCLKAGVGDYDCYGGSGNGPNYTPPGATIKVVGTDIFSLDGNDDGYGCN